MRLRTSPALVFYALPNGFVCGFVCGGMTPTDAQQLKAAGARLLLRAERRALVDVVAWRELPTKRAPDNVSPWTPVPAVQSRAALKHWAGTKKRQARVARRAKERARLDAIAELYGIERVIFGGVPIPGVKSVTLTHEVKS